MLWNHSKHFHDDVHGEIETVRKKWGALAGLGQGGEEKPAAVIVMEKAPKGERTFLSAFSSKKRVGKPTLRCLLRRLRASTFPSTNGSPLRTRFSPNDFSGAPANPRDQ